MPISIFTVESNESSHKGTKPHIDGFPDSQTAVEGKKVSFPVLVTGIPAPNITWYHNNSQIENGYAHDVAADGSLTIYTAEMKHAGVYKMVAANSVGSEEQTVKLSIIGDYEEMTPSLLNNTAKPLKQQAEPSPTSLSERSPLPHSKPAEGGIHVSQFGAYVSQNHAKANKGFKTLYFVSHGAV